MQKIRARGAGAGGFFDGMEVPAHLAAVSSEAVGVFGVGFEVDDDPAGVFEKCEIDDGFE